MNKTNNHIRGLLSAAVAMLLMATSLVAQVTPVYNVPSPEAANLGQYGAIPVGLFTGIPDITVPLHDAEVGKMTIPITISYHLAGVKPNNYPGSLGLGWSLQCSGSITRTVRGVYDEKRSVNHNHGYYWHCSEMQGITAHEFDQITSEYLESEDGNWYELSADEFSFSFLGYSGNFYVKPGGGWSVASDHDIKVEFDSTTGFGSFQSAEMLSRIPRLSQWPNRDENISFFKEFTLITPDGCRYVFGGENAIDFCVPYYSRSSSDLIATTWHLSRIETPDGREVSYSYRTDAIMVDLRYVPQKIVTVGVPGNSNDLVSDDHGRRGYSGFLLYPATLENIITPNDEIHFDYYPDLDYEGDYLRHSGEALYWEGLEYVRQSPYDGNLDDPANQFEVLFPSVSGETANVIRASIAASLRALVLHRMTVRPLAGGQGKSIYFSYLNETRRKLQKVVWRAGVPDIQITYLEGGGVLYPRYVIPANDSPDKMPEYTFRYNGGHMPRGYVFPQTDKWGYYNGQSFSPAAFFDTYSDAPMNLAATKYETLEEIVYPTGGSCIMSYEPHSFTKKEMPDHSVDEASGTAGGLRVRQIEMRERDGNVVSLKRYHYSESIGGPSSGVSRMENPTSLTYICGSPDDAEHSMSMTIASTYGFGATVTNLNSPGVGYTHVIEETLDGNGNSLGYIKNSFSNYDVDIYGNAHEDEPAFHSCNVSVDDAQPGIPYTSNSLERGKLMSKTWHRSNGEQTRREEYRYSRVGFGLMTTATQRLVYFSRNPLNPVSASVGWLTYTDLSSYLPIRKDIYEDGCCETIITEYDDHRMKVSESTLMGDTPSRTETFTYPYSHGDAYNWMTAAHFISPVVTHTVSENGMTRIVSNEYANAVSDGLVPYVRKTESRMGVTGSVKTIREVLQVDNWGNPMEVLNDGVKTMMFWGCLGQRLTKAIVGVTMIPEALSYNEDEYAVDGYIVTGPSFKYDYDTDMRLVKVTMPDGVSTCYLYDSLGRLKEEYYLDPSRNTVNQYEYHYYDEM